MRACVDEVADEMPGTLAVVRLASHLLVRISLVADIRVGRLLRPPVRPRRPIRLPSAAAASPVRPSRRSQQVQGGSK